MMKNTQAVYEDQIALVKEQEEKDKTGWDLKFQNYWGYIVAADSNYEQSISMCEKLFHHIGAFREHVNQKFHDIVNQMH